MSVEKDTATLSQILERVRRIEESGIQKTEFLEQPWDQDALIRNLEVIGEATKRLSPATKALAPDIPWTQMAGFRDLAIHGYDLVSLDRTWSIVEKELPRLKAAVQRLLKRRGSGPP